MGEKAMQRSNRVSRRRIQDILLNQVRKQRMEITIYLNTGVPIRGVVVSFDNFTILVNRTDQKDRKGNNLQTLIYKHAITTITPKENMNLRPRVVVRKREERIEKKEGEEKPAAEETPKEETPKEESQTSSEETKEESSS